MINRLYKNLQNAQISLYFYKSIFRLFFMIQFKGRIIFRKKRNSGRNKLSSTVAPFQYLMRKVERHSASSVLLGKYSTSVKYTYFWIEDDRDGDTEKEREERDEKWEDARGNEGKEEEWKSFLISKILDSIKMSALQISVRGIVGSAPSENSLSFEHSYNGVGLPVVTPIESRRPWSLTSEDRKGVD